MIPVVKISKNQLDYFRRLSRNSQKELLAMMIGEVRNPNLIVVHTLVHPKKYEESTYSSVAWSVEDQAVVEEAALKEGLRVVGDIHSHPSWDAVLSPNDHERHIEAGYRISGLCSTQGRKTRVRFWLAESSLPCTVEYL